MTTYTNVFGGNTIRPADASLTSLSLNSNQTLSWPGEGSSPFTSAIVEVTPDTAGRTLKMPDARRVSPGESVTFRNLGADSFALQDNAGGSIVTIASGAAYTVYLRSNSTAAGSWANWQAGAGSASVDASTIDGAGLEAASGLLRVKKGVMSYAISQAFSDNDRGSLAVWTGGSGTFTMPLAAVVGDGWYMDFKNDGSGTLTIAASGGETFDGDASISLTANQGATVASNGTNFSYIAHGVDAGTDDFSYTAISIAGTGDYTLNAAEYAKKAIKLTGLLTGNRNVIVPTSVRDYWVNNATTGAFTVTVKTAAGSGVTITQGKKATVYSDGTDVIAADTDYPSGISTPVSVANGGTGATVADTALTNLGGTTTGKSVFTAASAASGRSALSAAASGANTDITSIYLNNTGLKLKDTNASHGLIIAPGSDLTADRTLTVTTGDAARTLTLSANLTVNAETTISTQGAALIDDATAADQRTTLGLTLGSTTETLTGTATDRVVTPDSLAALWERGSDVASAGVISLGEGGYFVVTGTTTITDIDFATDKAGRVAWVRFSGALTLTHNATTLILPGSANITTAAGDVACFVSEGSDVVRCVSYNKASGQAVATSGGATLLGTITTTSGSEQGLTSLTLTSYKFLRLVFVGVSTTASTTITVSQSSGSGGVTLCSTSAGGDTMRGIFDIDLTHGTFFGLAVNAGTTASASASATAGDTNITTASTAVYVGAIGFDAGSVLVYGIA